MTPQNGHEASDHRAGSDARKGHQATSAPQTPTPGVLRLHRGIKFPTSYADAGGDEDVDLDDFGVLQACWTGDGSTITDPACQCIDRDGDNRISEVDRASFLACANTSGPGLPADKLCDGAP